MEGLAGSVTSLGGAQVPGALDLCDRMTEMAVIWCVETGQRQPRHHRCTTAAASQQVSPQPRCCFSRTEQSARDCGNYRRTKGGVNAATAKKHCCLVWSEAEKKHHRLAHQWAI
jgi:hypothetical protein